jgi:hypothetical protein
MGVDEARQALAARGVVETAPGEWTWDGEAHTTNDVAHTWIDLELSATPQGVAHGLDLLDLLGEYWVTCELGFVLHTAGDDTLWRHLWAGYRQRLEAPDPAGPVEYSLWVDHFEDRRTVAAAWAAMIDDEPPSTERALRRTTRVLPISGPVPWQLKHPYYVSLLPVPELHPALFQALLASYRDVYGSLEPRPALALLDQLRLPEGTPHLRSLRTVLTAGERNYYRNKDAWAAAELTS